MRGALANTVVDRVRDHVSAFASCNAVVDGDACFTYAELFDRVDRLSAVFVSLGLRRGEAVLAFLPNVHEAIECELAVLASGLVWITLTARLTWPEVRGVLVSCEPRLVVTDSEGAHKIAAGVEALPLDSLSPLVVTGEANRARMPANAASYEALLATHSPARPDVHVGLEEPARLRYTSGTTGSAKAAVLPHRVYHASLDNLLHELAPVTEQDCTLHAAPLTHGSGALLYPTLFAGGTNVLARHFDVEDVLATIERRRVTLMFTVPTMLSRLVASPHWASHDLSSMRALIYGGAPMPDAQLRAAIRQIGHALHQIYGMTEAPWPITRLGPEDHLGLGTRLGSVGKETAVCRVRIADVERRELGPEAVGEIQVRGRNVMSGYLSDDAATREVLRDGWLSTGDIGKKDADGYVYIVGRQKDVIISGGFNVYAAEVEAALCTHPGVLEAAVVGESHPDWGEAVVAYVVPRPGATITSDELGALVRSLLSGYKCPRRIEIRADLPKNPSGKIQKNALSPRGQGPLS